MLKNIQKLHELNSDEILRGDNIFGITRIILISRCRNLRCRGNVTSYWLSNTE